MLCNIKLSQHSGCFAVYGSISMLILKETKKTKQKCSHQLCWTATLCVCFPSNWTWIFAGQGNAVTCYLSMIIKMRYRSENLNAFIISYIINNSCPIVLQCAAQHFLHLCDDKLLDRTEIQKVVRKAPGASCLLHCLFLLSIKIVCCLWLWYPDVLQLLILSKFTGKTLNHWCSYSDFSSRPCVGDHLLQS